VAIGGWPAARTRLSVQTQAAGLAGLLVVIAVVVGVRTASW
jgi:hypothetical protein